MNARLVSPNRTTVDDLLANLRHFWTWPVVAGIGLLVFFVMPGGYGDTAHSLLHGLCAQTPSHTFMFDGQRLPFDGRMTGIYAGCLISVVSLLLTGHFRYGNPTVPMIAVLAALVGLMGLDGFNSLFTDLGLWHPWQSTNELRLITGYGAGLALGVATTWLTASSLWKISDGDPVVPSWRTLILPLGLVIPYLLIVVSGWSLFFPVLVFFLVVASWFTVSTLSLVIVLLGFRLEDQIGSIRQLHIPITIAALVGLVVMISLAGARFWFERQFGISNAMM